MNKFREWIGFGLVQLGWKILRRKNKELDSCLGYAIEKNGIKYSVDFYYKRGW